MKNNVPTTKTRNQSGESARGWKVVEEQLQNREYNWRETLKMFFVDGFVKSNSQLWQDRFIISVVNTVVLFLAVKILALMATAAYYVLLLLLAMSALRPEIALHLVPQMLSPYLRAARLSLAQAFNLRW
uniref:Uncharacterized protein n=1 Tax=Graphocephala atropunctata TaxID=36148 RepID=A0A1B6KF60_9HEMI